ncbi:MAG: hypothetical protein ACD_30C00087G0008 [uncultured bacterium]|uniref:Uncharacterized protein n=3 Tax=Candidatus Daviesiibacteriota TaxID=1752718 RepID=A0A0G0EY72_9BACT|nr:MAG: hypothetical protein ACD_30C00087G0008 [uncultured bacterium]KKQ10472.1 MAG: hypothetical protein US19_C0004G0020 [Candidatus Daviesbacteria bacterium GW2011_GWB1_36_5]KKQ16204.1 MAG: hypothetical protein US28_C0004G0046 [Candidatus Daviesbacteria bacterium GW2011_GWA1_36_8]OGE33276.1 MAG: hypothetical protein A3C99_01530 [Candidatus Daviesbacteria bacterium RIFCSPHIGHO2_02_FULL_37_9]OGE36179.1 MAG: hypothetical protein A3E66_05220 [Candidatus Daviesbacteria bacterium RIFCSPHIGHO2_12_FU
MPESPKFIPFKDLEMRPRIVQLNQDANGHQSPELRMPDGFVQDGFMDMRPRVLTRRLELAAAAEVSSSSS